MKSRETGKRFLSKGISQLSCWIKGMPPHLGMVPGAIIKPSDEAEVWPMVDPAPVLRRLANTVNLRMNLSHKGTAR